MGKLSIEGVQKKRTHFMEVVTFAGKEWFIVGGNENYLWLSDGESVCIASEADVWK